MLGNQVRRDLQPVPKLWEVQMQSGRSSLRLHQPQLWGLRQELCRRLPQLWDRGSFPHLLMLWSLLA